MNNYTLTIPNDIYTRAQEIAEATAQSAEQVLMNYLRALSAPLPNLPADEEAELAALHQLSNDALWTIAREQMPANTKTRMQVLMDKNSAGTITSDEHQELTQLVERGQRLRLRKSEAAAILSQRGFHGLARGFGVG